METHVFAIVLMAALLHATWNAFVKVDGDRLWFMTVLMTGGGLGALCVTPFVAFPAPEVWPYIAASILLHLGYASFLILAYRFGDLSHVYPLARGSAPLIVALVSVTLLDEALSGSALFGVALMAAGIMSLSLTRREQHLNAPLAAFFALGTGLFIAAYTLTDAVGARLAVSAHSYAAWMLGLEWIPLAAFTLWSRRADGMSQIRRTWALAVPMGLLSLAAYWAVIWAMTVAPAALVAYLRETSIVFAVLFGVVILKERLSLARLAAIFATLTGAVVLKLNRP
jgi:drug/metabolite transporter (DMT)-like permease